MAGSLNMTACVNLQHAGIFKCGGKFKFQDGGYAVFF
jgi:hypothetical protein